MSEKELMKVVGFMKGCRSMIQKALLMKRTDTCTQFTGSSGKSQRSIC